MSSRSLGALEAIRSLLLSGALGVGDPLQEITLADSLGVSRTPVREALHRLEADGVVERSGRGYVVAGVDQSTEVKITVVRQALEPLAAALAAAAVTDGYIAPIQLVSLRESVSELRRAGEAGDVSLAASANHRFHIMLGELSMNEVLGEAIARLNDRLVIATRGRLSTAEWAKAASRQHEAIVDAIEAGDREAAADAVRAHLAKVGQAGQDTVDTAS